jgi:hypothetical protein
VIERFAAVSGLLPSTLDRMLRPLRDAGLVPKGAKGRGQRHGHFEPPHLANLIMALAGMQPSDAAEAVNLLRPLVPANSALASGAQVSDLGSTIEFLIRELSKGDRSGSAQPFALTFCLNPLQGTLSRVDGTGSLLEWRYIPAQEALPDMPPREMPAVWRVTTVNSEILELAGELWRNALRNREALLLYVDCDPATPVSACPKSETAASLPGVAAALGDQTAETVLGGSSQLHPSGERENSQSPSDPQPRSLPSTRLE